MAIDWIPVPKEPDYEWDLRQGEIWIHAKVQEERDGTDCRWWWEVRIRRGEKRIDYRNDVGDGYKPNHEDALLEAEKWIKEKGIISCQE